MGQNPSKCIRGIDCLSWFLFLDGGEVLGNLLPVINTRKSGCGQVVRCGVKQAPAFKVEQIAGLVVDEEVGAENGFVAAEDVMCGRDEGEVALQPALLGAE
jgi:hypothetical protein